MDDPDGDFIESITPDVMRGLDQIHFFEKLDDLLCPADASVKAEECIHGFSMSKSILFGQGFDDEKVEDVLSVLHRQGACCDCEVLYNVSEANRLKATYWKAEAARLEREAESNES